MHEPYKLVLVNIVASVLLLLGVLFYKFIYPKKKINLFFLLVIISIIPVISVLRMGDYESGDFNIHIRRSMEFYEVLSQGNFIPSWAGNLNATYGYPLFAFNYILPYYAVSFFHFIGLSFIASLKAFLILNFIFSGIFMYLFSRKYFKNVLAAFSASIFYLFAPYHLIALHFKITIGEILAYTLIPLFFYFVYRLCESKKNIFTLLSGLILGLITLSHIFISIFLLPLFFVLLYNNTKNIVKSSIYFLEVIFISLLISAFQWSSSIIYRPYLFTTANPIDPSKTFYFPNIIDLLYSPWRYGLLFQGPKGELSFLIGYAQILALIMLLILLFKDKLKLYKTSVFFWIVLFFLTIFLITPQSVNIWKFLPLINGAGSQRLLIIVAFITSLFVGYLCLAIKKRKWIIYTLILFAILTTILNWGQRRVIPTINDSVLRKTLPLGTTWGDTHFYALPKWINTVNPWFSSIPKNHLEIIKGRGTVKNIFRSSTAHYYSLVAQTPVTLKENTLYFPGWVVKANDEELRLRVDKKGVIIFSLPKGTYTLLQNYQDLPLFFLTKLISILSVLIIVLYSLMYLVKNKLIKLPKF